MEMDHQNKKIILIESRTKSERKRRKKLGGVKGFAALLLVISLFVAGCSFPREASGAAETEISATDRESVNTAAEESSEASGTGEQVSTQETDGSEPLVVVTDNGTIEVVGLESADPKEYLEPEDLPLEETENSGNASEEEGETESDTVKESGEDLQKPEAEVTPEPTTTPAPTPKPQAAKASADPMERVVDFATLQSTKNADIYAWISVPGTNIDYPVLRHPTDDGYYLYHNLNGSKGYPGCIYTENCNSKDWTDPVTVLYGHDMRSTNSMFHQLHKFEKQNFFDAYEFFYIYTPDKTLKYHIFSAYVHTNEHLLGNHNFGNKDEFDSFFGTVLGTNNTVSHVRDGVAVDSSSKVVALSTCIKNQPNNRYIVFGVLVE